jgi:hypothetical protein
MVALHASCPELPTLCTSTAAVFFNVILSKVVTLLSASRLHLDSGIDVCHPDKHVSPADVDTATNAQLTIMISYVKIFEGLVCILNITSVQSMDHLLGQILRHARSFTDAYLRTCIPVLTITVRHNTDVAVVLIKQMQKCTRYVSYVFLSSTSSISCISAVH